MKKMMLKTIYVITIAAIISSCSGTEKKTDTPAGGDIKAKTEAKSETKTTGGANQPGTHGATVSSVRTMVQKDWKAMDGKEVTISAYPQGFEKVSKNGEFLLYLEDKPKSGNMNFAASFKEDMREEVKKYKGDAMINITGNISTPNGIIALKNAKIIE